MKCGQVLLVNYPFTDHAGSKMRPALVVSADAFNGRQDFAVVPISAKTDPNDEHVFSLDSGAAYFGDTGLKPESRYVRWSKLMTITAAIVQRKLGQMPQPQLSQIQRAIRGMFE
jgi:mRNA interferase MazF